MCVLANSSGRACREGPHVQSLTRSPVPERWLSECKCAGRLTCRDAAQRREGWNLPRHRALGSHPSVRPSADGVGADGVAAASFVARAVLSSAQCRRGPSAFARVIFASSLAQAWRPSTGLLARAGLTKTCRPQWRRHALAGDGPRLAQPSLSIWVAVPWSLVPWSLRAAGPQTAGPETAGPETAGPETAGVVRRRGLGRLHHRRARAPKEDGLAKAGRRSAKKIAKGCATARRRQGSGEEIRAGAPRSSNEQLGMLGKEHGHA